LTNDIINKKTLIEVGVRFFSGGIEEGCLLEKKITCLKKYIYLFDLIAFTGLPLGRMSGCCHEDNKPKIGAG